jgi:carboxypeptidase D
VVRALHATSKETAWVECDNSVSNQLYLHNTPAAINLIPGILEAGVEVMLFAGDEDLICNYVGIERTINRMKWSGRQGLGVRGAVRMRRFWIPH